MKKVNVIHIGSIVFLIILQVFGTVFLAVELKPEVYAVKIIILLVFNWVMFILMIKSIFKNYSGILSKYNKMNNRYEMVAAFYDLLKEISDIEDRQRVYKRILEAAIEAVPNATRGTIMLHDKGYAYFETAIGFDMNYLDLIELKFEDTALYKNTDGKMNKAVIINDVLKSAGGNLDQNIVDLFIIAGVGPVRSSIAVPISSKGEILGSINLDSDYINSFAEEDIRIIEIFSYEVSRIIQLYTAMENNVRMSRYDDLTQIYNRGYGHQLIREHIDNRMSFILTSIDLNNLKIVNDRYGHDLGDELIKHFVNNMKIFIEENVIFARYGGDEFIMLFPGYDLVEVQVIMDDTMTFFSNHPIEDKEEEVFVSFSYGIAQFPIETTDYDELLKLADKRMYKKKKEIKELLK